MKHRQTWKAGLSCGTDDSLEIGGDVVITAWINISQLPGAGDYTPIVSRGKSGDGAGSQDQALIAGGSSRMAMICFAQ